MNGIGAVMLENAWMDALGAVEGEQAIRQATVDHLVITWAFRWVDPTDRALRPVGSYPEWRLEWA